MFGFLHFGIFDLIDIFIVAYLFYQFFVIIRGTAALNIFYVVIGAYFIWLLVQALNMKLLSTILGHVMGVGVIAILIVFQQEVRRFLLMLGAKSQENFKINRFLNKIRGKEECNIPIKEILTACEYMRDNKIGALIVLSDKDTFENYYESGQMLDATVNSRLLETIFFKNSPLHDGAMFIVNDKITAAACVLPLSERTDLPYYLGLRHRAAIGITEASESLAIIVSEERGQISFAEYGKVILGVEIITLKQKIESKFFINQKNNSEG
ncbi:MAG: diadenylate cyclase [Bacteroidales bacterium]|nr:diadenylate cyclase [Bacteroidales bacterium]